MKSSCGSGRTVFGENAKLVRITKQHLVFETESGSIVKTEINTLNTVGKARKEGYFVSIGKRDYESKNIIQIYGEYYCCKCGEPLFKCVGNYWEVK